MSAESKPHSVQDDIELIRSHAAAMRIGLWADQADKVRDAIDRIEEQLREEQRAFRAYKEHVMRTVEAFVEEVRP